MSSFIESTPNICRTTWFTDYFTERQKAIVKVENDGNCLFRALEHFIHTDWKTIKRKCIEEMLNNRADYEAYLETPIELHCKKLAKPIHPKWAGQTEMKAIAKIFNIGFKIFQMFEGKVTENPQVFTIKPSHWAELCFTGAHYSPVVKKEKVYQIGSKRPLSSVSSSPSTRKRLRKNK